MPTMKAAVCHAYNDLKALRIEDVPTPTPRADEVLIRVVATTVSSADARIRCVNVPAGMAIPMRLALGITKLRQPVLGTELAGVIEAVGSAVTSWRIGDEVIAFPGAKMGAHAQFKTMKHDGKIIPKPAGMSFESAAALCFGGLTAMHYLQHKARVKQDESVLIVGATGTVGSAAVQIARHMGAQVTAVCSGNNMTLAKQLGAHHTIDYHREDFTTHDARYDIIMDCIGIVPVRAAKRVMNDHGRLLRIVCGLPGLIAAPFHGLLTRKHVIAGVSGERLQDMHALAQLAQAGRLKPLIDSTYPFDQITSAYARVESNRKRGSIVLRL